jgi:hypothetical protein
MNIDEALNIKQGSLAHKVLCSFLSNKYDGVLTVTNIIRIIGTNKTKAKEKKIRAILGSFSGQKLINYASSVSYTISPKGEHALNEIIKNGIWRETCFFCGTTQTPSNKFYNIDPFFDDYLGNQICNRCIKLKGWKTYRGGYAHGLGKEFESRK